MAVAQQQQQQQQQQRVGVGETHALVAAKTQEHTALSRRVPGFFFFSFFVLFLIFDWFLSLIIAMLIAQRHKEQEQGGEGGSVER